MGSTLLPSPYQTTITMKNVLLLHLSHNATTLYYEEEIY